METRPKKVQYALETITYRKSNGARQIYLESIYKKPSSIKVMAWRRIVRLYNEKHGVFITVIKYNYQCYTAGFFYEDKCEWWFAFFDRNGDYITRLSPFERRAARLPLPHMGGLR